MKKSPAANVVKVPAVSSRAVSGKPLVVKVHAQAKKVAGKKAAAKKVAGKAVAKKATGKKVAGPGILSLDVGGTGLKVTVIDESGTMLHERVRVATPHPCPPAVLLKLVSEMAKQLPAFNRIAVGFPGVIRDGHVLTAANLGNDAWVNFDLATALSDTLGGYPAHVVNDADMQGYGLITGKGLEMVATLGTGVGTALFRDGQLMPHMELAHHPIKGDKTYDEYLGDVELKRIGKKRWNKRLERALKLFDVLLHPDRIFLGGGNSRLVTIELASHIVIGSNEAGIEGGAALWRKP
jgi:polyphosphate glucokinase